MTRRLEDWEMRRLGDGRWDDWMTRRLGRWRLGC